MIIIKRDNSKVKFKQEKIVDAIVKAMGETKKGIDEDLAWGIAETIVLELVY